MREFKFRAWDKEFKKWSDTPLKYAIEDINFYTDYEWNQYTGLKDVNGREIYEGDIFEITFDQDVYHEELGDITIQRKDKEVVRFVNGCFKVGY